MTDQRDIQVLLEQLRQGKVDRRGFVQGAAAAGVSTAAMNIALRHAPAGAQEATPATPGATPTGTGGAMTSITRQEYLQQLKDNFDLGEPANQGGTLIYGLASDIQTTNPALAGDIYSLLVVDLVFDYLTEASAIDGQMVPRLADYWEVADDGVTYTFYLNQQATWHDGEPVTAHDVVFSFDATLGEGSLSRRSGVVSDVLASYEAIDDHTVQLVAREPYATFLEDTTWVVAVMPRHIWEDVPLAEWGGDPGSSGADPARVVGSGQFRFLEWELGDHVTLVRNDEWRDSEPMPVIDEFMIRVLPDQNTSFLSLSTGDIDVLGIPSARVEETENDPNLTLHVYPSAGFSLFSANQDPERSPLFTDARVRQALMYALDRELMIETIYLGYGQPAIGTQAPLSIAYAPERINTVYNFDPDRARQLLDEAGWAVGQDGIREKDGYRLSFECLYVDGTIAYEQQIPYMIQVWGDVGVEMIAAPVPFGVMGEHTRPGNFDMALYGFSWGFDGGQGAMFRCENTPPAGFNSMRYCNPEYDELDSQAATELDPERRVDLLIEATNVVNDDAGGGVLFFFESFTAAGSRVQNFIPNGYALFWSIPYIWLEMADQ